MPLFLGLLVMLAACAGAGNSSMKESLSVRLLMSSSHCGVMDKEAGLSIISSGNEMEKATSRIARDALGDSFNTVFDRELVIQINMGLKPTGGYSLALTEDVYISKDNWVVIGLRWNIPPKGAMLTQALTSPCLLVAIPKRKYEGISVIDQTGEIRLQMSQ